MPDTREGPSVRSYTPTALPSVTARLLAFVAILVGGACGGLITYSLVDLQCGSDDDAAAILSEPATDGATGPAPSADDDEGCPTVAGLAGLLGAAATAAGVAVISVLVLRAMAEWRKDLDVEAGARPQRTSRSRRKPSA